MRGTLHKQKCGHHWMRIGYADSRFSTVFILLSSSLIVCFTYWVFRAIPKTEWLSVHFLAIYFIATILYMNFGVWLHEQLHCLAYRSDSRRTRTQIIYKRKFIMFLSGHYQVTGATSYRIQRLALLAPLIMSISLVIVGWLGSFFLPGWWLPISLTMAIVSLMDMIHDLYMFSKIRAIGEKGKYWDRGRVLEVVWAA
jgi:hypothetical protein